MFVNDFFSRQYLNRALLIRNRLIMKQNELQTSKQVFENIGNGLKRDLEALDASRELTKYTAAGFCNIYNERKNSHYREKVYRRALEEYQIYAIFDAINRKTNNVH
jgi:hypothetical protein